MPASPAVTVIIPTRDGDPSRLARAVRSVLGQTFDDLQVCVVDDGSSTVVELPGDVGSDPRVRLVRIEPAGAAAARNAGARASTSSFLAFLDGDDEWMAGKLAAQIDALGRSDGSVAVAVCGYEMWSQGELLYRHIPIPGRPLAKTLLTMPCLQPSSILVRRDVFEELGGFDTGLVRIEDWDFAVRLADRYGEAVIPEALVRRERSDHPPVVHLRSTLDLIERLKPRIEALPESEHDRVLRHHLTNVGVFAARAGDRRTARSALWRAWRLDPRTFRPLLQSARLVVPDGVWRLAGRLRRKVVASARPRVGAAPPDRRW